MQVGYADSTSDVLLAFVLKTEAVLRDALRGLDGRADCRIIPSLELGFPHDVARLAGGFPTGCVVEWDCEVPVVPVDTTVNTCTSSVYELRDFPQALGPDLFSEARRRWAGGFYLDNFHRGNHFITFARSRRVGTAYLVLHSSAAEFKKGFTGLYPVPGNWYAGAIQLHHAEGRYLRYVVGAAAERFTRIALSLPSFNELRHDFFAETLVSDPSLILSSKHHHHYGMPRPGVIAIGAFLARTSVRVPIFSAPGLDIWMFEVGSGPPERTVTVDGAELHVVPHGWGKRSATPPSVTLSSDYTHLTVNGRSFANEIDSSLRAHPDLVLRSFSEDEGDPDFFPDVLRQFVGGDMVDRLIQLASYSKAGVTMWDEGGGRDA